MRSPSNTSQATQRYRPAKYNTNTTIRGNQRSPNMSPLHSPQTYGHEYMESVIFPRSDRPFQKEIKTILNDEATLGSWSDWTIFRKNVVLKEGPYVVIIVEHKMTREQKLCKVYTKSSLRGRDYSMTDVKREIFAHTRLNSSGCILKLEEVFEHRKELFLVYEMAELFDNDFMISSAVLDKEKLKKLLCMTMIAVNEINTLRMAVCLIHRGMFARTRNGDYKLFNFVNLNQYDTLKGDVSSKFPKFIETSKTKVGQMTDSWTLGVWMAMLYKPHSFDFKSMRYSFDYFHSFQKDSLHNYAEKEVFQATLGSRASDRIKIEDIFHLDYFQQIMKRNPKLKQKAIQGVGHIGKVNIRNVISTMRKSIMNSGFRKNSAISRNKSTASPQSSVIRFVNSASDRESLARTANPKQVKEQLSQFFGNTEKEYQGMRKSKMSEQKTFNIWTSLVNDQKNWSFEHSFPSR